MTKAIVKKDIEKSKEAANKPYSQSCFISKSNKPQILNRLDGEIIGGFNVSNSLESMPQEILVNIITKLKHGDLKHIMLVSKLLSEGAKIARETHFLFSTPSQKPVFRSGLEISDSEAPNAPKASKRCRALQQKARRSRFLDKRHMSFRIVLFPSPKSSRMTVEST